MKGREDTKPFIVLAASIDQLRQLGIAADVDLLRSAASHLARSPHGHPSAARADPGKPRASSLAVRIPALDWLRALIARTGPLVSTSANRSGEPPVERPVDARARLAGRPRRIVDGGVRERANLQRFWTLPAAEPRFIREGEHFFTQKVWKTLRKTL